VNKIEQRIADEREHLNRSQRYARYAAILARFEKEFGEENILWVFMDYRDDIGIAYTLKMGGDNVRRITHDGPIQMRIAYRFGHKTCTELHEEAALQHLRDWIKNPTCPPGVLDDYCLEGNEISVAGITSIPEA
jgi:hypothetical protein